MLHATVLSSPKHALTVKSTDVTPEFSEIKLPFGWNADAGPQYSCHSSGSILTAAIQ